MALLVQTAANFYYYFIHPDRQVDIIHLWLLVNTDCWLPGQHCWHQLAKSGRVSSGASSGRAWRFWSKQLWNWRLQYDDYLQIIILYAGFSESNLKAEGYKSTDDYFMGRSRFNESVFGWRGIKVAWSGSTDNLYKCFRNLKVGFLRQTKTSPIPRFSCLFFLPSRFPPPLQQNDIFPFPELYLQFSSPLFALFLSFVPLQNTKFFLHATLVTQSMGVQLARLTKSSDV